MKPIEIIGGGLAGLSLGIALRRTGVAVTIYEAADYPRHRVCGEFITGLAPRTIEQLQLAPLLSDALRHEEVAWCIGDETPRIQRLPAPALGLSRYVLDARLAEAFVDLGGELRTHARIAETTNEPGRVFATGRRRALDPQWLGLKIHARGLRLTRDLEMHLGEQSYVGLSRIEDDAVNICGLFHQRDIVERGADLLLGYLRAAGLEGLAERVGDADLETSSFCAVAALNFDRRVDAGSRICLGDAGAAIPPFTGHGMAMAFQSAAIALSPLIEYARGAAEWPATCKRTNVALRAHFRLRLASAQALHPFLLRPRRQRWFAALSRVRLLPFRMLYASVH